MKISIKKGDNVLVIAGKDKGKQGKVSEVSPNGRVTVENVNIVTKHQKPRNQQDKGGLIKKSAPIDNSNVMVVCPSCSKATRIAHKELDGKKVRVCKKCGLSLDKEFVKVTKKDAKSQKKETKVESAVEEKKPEVKKAPVKKAVAPKTTVKAAPKKSQTATKVNSTRKTVSSSGK